VAIEDAGFDVRDSIAWLYGSGFPKSLDISKAIDRVAGAERESLGRNPNSRENATKANTLYESGTVGKTADITEPATDDAKKWSGWGTALKPAFEPIVVARKPLVGTVAANVLAFGTGGLNIDASRIGYQGEKPSTWFDQQERKNQNIPFGSTADTTEPSSLGRWPANIILDEYTAGLLDEQSGDSKPKPERSGIRGGKQHFEGGWNKKSIGTWVADLGGGASRFFYVAKASKKDRNEGLEDLEGKEIGAKDNGLGRTCATCSASVLDGCECADRTFVNPTRQNFHPTVKPTALMEYLVKLVTPLGGTVLDPFTGSGSTGKAALLNGFKFIGIELTADYLPIIEGRLKHAAETYANQATEEETKEQETLF
jgi:site-specific DNA-methyltransferase (adenine-specific)